MGIFLALVAALGNALFQVVMKLLGKRTKKIWVNASAYEITAGLVMLVAVFFEAPKYDFSTPALIPLVLAWIMWGIVSGVNFMAVKKLEISTNMILSQFALVVSFIGAVILFNDKITPLRIIGAIMIVASTFIVFAKKDSFKNISKSGIVLRILASTIFAIAGLLDKHNSMNFSIAIYTSTSYLVPGLLAAVFSRENPAEYFIEVKKNFKYILTLTLFSVIAYISILLSFRYIDTSLAYTIFSLSTLITVAIGIVFFKERDNLVRKVVALIIVVIAAVILNMS